MEMSGNVTVFVSRDPIWVKQRGRCARAMAILPKAAGKLTNVELSKYLFGNMLVEALRYARYNCASYEEDRVP